MLQNQNRLILYCLFILLGSLAACSENTRKAGPPSPIRAVAGTLVPIAPAWANNSVNAVIFRKNSLVTHGNTQYAAYYDTAQYLVLAKRRLGTNRWEIRRSAFQGNATDAHNSICIMADAMGYLHVAWDHHNNALHYSKTLSPGSLALGPEQSMTGQNENKVTYPEFFQMPSGDLLFLYRDGGSGRGNLVVNRYDSEKEQWQQLHTNLLDGEEVRNAYWQAYVDEQGTVHLSWVWRESWDVATNHDLCYARSKDGGRSWENSRGKPYQLPIRQASAEIAWQIPQNAELMNQTSMTADSLGNPVIASYWRAGESPVPQYRAVYHNGSQWQSLQISGRTTPFSLSGIGTKRIPISRPQILLGKGKNRQQALLLFRDVERGSRASVALCDSFPAAPWRMLDLTDASLGAWEPTYDTELWKEQGVLHLFVQKVEQLDGEGLANVQAETVSVLEWTASQLKK